MARFSVAIAICCLNELPAATVEVAATAPPAMTKSLTLRPSAELTAAKKYGSPSPDARGLSPFDASATRVSAPQRPVSWSDTTPPMRVPVAASTRAERHVAAGALLVAPGHHRLAVVGGRERLVGPRAVAAHRGHTGIRARRGRRSRPSRTTPGDRSRPKSGPRPECGRTRTRCERSPSGSPTTMRRRRRWWPIEPVRRITGRQRRTAGEERSERTAPGHQRRTPDAGPAADHGDGRPDPARGRDRRLQQILTRRPPAPRDVEHAVGRPGEPDLVADVHAAGGDRRPRSRLRGRRGRSRQRERHRYADEKAEPPQGQRFAQITDTVAGAARLLELTA